MLMALILHLVIWKLVNILELYCSRWRVFDAAAVHGGNSTDFIPWSCSCEAKAPARAPGGAGFKGQRPLRTVSPPFEIQLRLFVVGRTLVAFSSP